MRPLLNWFRRRRLERSFDRELEYHLDRRAGELRQTGLSESDARRQAAIELGGLSQVRESVRDVWLSAWMRDFVYDLRFALRSFRQSPSFTATAVLSLALGIAATTSMYSLLDQVVMHALPVRDPHRLVLVDWKGDQAANGFGTYNLMSYPICRDLERQNRFFDGVLCRAATTISLSTGAESKRTLVEIVSGNYFSILGVEPAFGRLLTPEDDARPDAHPVVVLSYDFWRTQLAGARDVVGRKVLVNQHPMIVVGVAGPHFRGIDVGEVPALWIPAAMSSRAIPGFTGLLDRRSRWMQVLGRLGTGVTLTEAQAGLQPWFKALLNEDMRRPGFPRLEPERLRRYLGSSLSLEPAPHGHSSLRRRLSDPLWALFAGTAVLLALACLNVAGLFLARASAREREISTRCAMGASFGRIGRQLLTESLLLAFVAGLLGTMLAPIAIRMLIGFLPADVAANALHAAIDTRLLMFSMVVSATAGLVAGFAPAIQAGRRSLISTLRERGGTARGGLRLRKTLVACQIAFTLILVVGATLFVRTLVELVGKGPGFRTSSLVSFGIDPIRNGYSRTGATQLVARIHEEIRASGTVQASAVARFPLLTGGSWNNPMTIQAGERITTDRDVNMNAISPGFFGTLGTRLVAGRDFDARDVQAGSDANSRTAIVNEAFVRRYFRGRNPLGARIGIGSGPGVQPDLEIIGVVEDINYRSLRDASEQAYFPLSGIDSLGAIFYVRVAGGTDAAFDAIRTTVRHADPSLPMSFLRTVDDQVQRSLVTERILAALSTCFGFGALLLSLVGLYGVMSYSVTQRTREIGIRLALGAPRRTAVWLIARDAVVMIATGVAIALPCLWAMGRLIESQLYEVRPTDPASVSMAVLVLCSGALLAAVVPAHRASAVAPADALRFN